MPSGESLRRCSVSAARIGLLAAWLTTALAGCAAPSVERQPGAQRVSDVSCSLRALVTLRQGSFTRSESDVVEIGRRLGINLSVLQSMGRNSKMVIIRERGPEEACEQALSELRTDLGIESIQRQ